MISFIQHWLVVFQACNIVTYTRRKYLSFVHIEKTFTMWWYPFSSIDLSISSTESWFLLPSNLLLGSRCVSSLDPYCIEPQLSIWVLLNHSCPSGYIDIWQLTIQHSLLSYGSIHNQRSNGSYIFDTDPTSTIRRSFLLLFFFTKDSLKVQQTAGEICGMKEKYSLRLIFLNLNASLK